MTELHKNPFASLMKYELYHLVEHLDVSGRPEDLHRLLAIETCDQHNAWYEAQVEIGAMSNFRADTMRAWQIAEDISSQSDSVVREKYFGLQNRYALILASLTSLAENYPSELVTALVLKGVWQPEEGLAHAYGISDPTKQAETFKDLLSCLPTSLALEALIAATIAIQKIEQREERRRAISELISSFMMTMMDISPHPCSTESSDLQIGQSFQPNYLRQMLTIVRALSNPVDRAFALVALSSHLTGSLKEEVHEEAVLTARAIGPSTDRAEVLVTLALQAPIEQKDQLLREALVALQEIPWYVWGQAADLLALLAPHLPTPLHKRAVTIACGIHRSCDQATALVAITPHLSATLLLQALAGAQKIKEELDRTRALARIAPLLPEQLHRETLQEVIAQIRGIRDPGVRGEALAELAPSLTELFFSDVLELVREVPVHICGFHNKAIVGIARYLPSSLIKTLLDISCQIVNGPDRMSALAALAPHLSESMLVQALAAACTISEDLWRAAAIVKLAPYLSEPLLREALATTKSIDRQFCRAEALTGLIPYLPQQLKEEVLELGLAAVSSIDSENLRASQLVKLVPYLSQRLVPCALKIAETIKGRECKAKVLRELLVPSLSNSLLNDLVEVVQKTDDTEIQAQVLVELASHLPFRPSRDLLIQALSIASQVRDVDVLATGQIRFIPQLLDMPRTNLPTDRSDRERDNWTQATKQWAIRAGELGSLREAIAVTRQVANDDIRATVLATIAPYLLLNHKEELVQEMLAVAHEIHSSKRRTQTLATLLPYLPERKRRSTIRQMLDSVSSLDSFSFVPGTTVDARLQVLLAVAPYLQPSQMATAGMIAREVEGDATDRRQRVEAWAIQAHCRPEMFGEKAVQEMLDLADNIEPAWARAEALASLTMAFVETEQWEIIAQKALYAIDQAKRDEDKGAILERIAGTLPKTLFHEAILIARKIRTIQAREDAFTALSRCLATVDRRALDSLWRQKKEGVNLLHALADRPRENIIRDLCALAPLMRMLGGEESIRETFEAVRDVGRWWP